MTLLHRFLRDRKASVAPMLALTAIPLLGFVGAAVDYSNASSVRTSMQSALDATTLMLARNAQNLSSAQINQNGTSYFAANLSNSQLQGLSVTVSTGT